MSVFPDRDDPDRPAFMAGYRVGELERIALATANSELRSRVLALTADLESRVASPPMEGARP